MVNFFLHHDKLVNVLIPKWGIKMDKGPRLLFLPLAPDMLPVEPFELRIGVLPFVEHQ